MIDVLPPGTLMVLGALLVPLVPKAVRKFYLLALPIVSFVHLLGIPIGTYGYITIFDYTLQVVRVDKLSLVFGYIFHLASFISVIYGLHEEDMVQHISGVMYAGSAIGAAFAGDLVTLFVYWEATAITSVFLIWARRTEKAYRVGLRYLVIQVGSGVILLSGVLLRVQAGESLAFNHIGLDSPGGLLIFLAFGIKCAFPLLHNWLQDAYPEATVIGTVFLSAFTTKLAVYAMARGYAGTEWLIWIGAIMTAFPVFFAVIENDLRRVLAYSLNNQLGFMLVGVGIGTELAINGAVSHAFAHILYKALLFMSMGAVLYRVGTVKASELGGLYRSMPITTFFCLIGAAAISAFPLFSGFVTKSMTVSAVGEQHMTLVWLTLTFASAGVLHHSGIRIPFCGFFGHDSGKRCKEAPTNMLVAMGLTAFFCIGIGVYPDPLYAILPYAVDYQPYTTGHVVTQLQLLVCALAAFGVIARKHLEPPEVPATNLDTDWVYRKALPVVLKSAVAVGSPIKDGFFEGAKALVRGVVAEIAVYHNNQGIWGRTWLTRHNVFVVTIFLAVYLLFYY